MDNENVEMRSFSKEIEQSTMEAKKSVCVALTEIGIFFSEIAMAILPVLIVWVISKLIIDAKFPLLEHLVNSELLWFSITTMVLLNLKSVIYGDYRSPSRKITVLVALFATVVYTAFFVFLKLSEMNVIDVELNSSNVLVCIIACIIITIVINISATLTDRKGV